MSNPNFIGMNINPTKKQKLSIRNLHRTSRDYHVRDKIQCILLSADGWMPEMIAHSQLINETTVRRHFNDWLNGEKLAPANGGSDSYLSEEQTATLVAYL